MRYEEFIVENVFEKVVTKKIKGKAGDFPTSPTDDYVIPLLTAGIANQGLARYAKREQCPTILHNVFSVSANGENSGAVFYQPDEFAVLQDAYAIRIKGYDIQSEEVGLFIASVLNKAISTIHNWNYKATWGRVKNTTIPLPIKEDINDVAVIDQNSGYHADGYVPDWGYMEQYIRGLEQERVTELDNYLTVTGLNDYQLTDDDKEVIDIKVFKEDRTFRIGDLFISQTGDVDLQQKNINGKGTIFINSGIENNGVKGMTDRVAKIFPANTISIDFWGNAYYRDFEYKMATHNHVFSLSGDCIKNEYIGLYIVSKMAYMKNLFSYSNMGTWNKIKELFILLPIQTDADNNPVLDKDCKYHPDGYIPDWDFMEKYIKAIEKIVIADVVKYKDDMIALTKQVIV